MTPVPGTPMHAGMTIAKVVADRLAEIEKTLKRQLELNQGLRRQFLMAGTVAGGGTAAAGGVTTVILAANANRRGLSIQNLSPAGGPTLTIGLGTTSVIPNTGIVLAPQASWDGRVSELLWPGSVCIQGAGTGTLYSWLEA